MKAGLYNYRAIVRSIYDGDTISAADVDLGMNSWLLNKQIRLVGIDTPEIRSRDNIEKKMGYAAKAFLLEKTPIGEDFILESIKDKEGKFGRLLGRIWFEDGAGWSCVNDLLVKRKLAQPYEGGRRRPNWPAWYETHAETLDPLLEKYAV